MYTTMRKILVIVWSIVIFISLTHYIITSFPIKEWIDELILALEKLWN